MFKGLLNKLISFFVPKDQRTRYQSPAVYPKHIEEFDQRFIEYLTTRGNSYYLEKLLNNATSRIILISPFIRIHDNLKRILKEKKQNGFEIIIVCRIKDLKDQLNDYSTKIVDVPKLHAKCYLNEHEAIITSLNLHCFSELNNEEMGIYIKNESIGKALYSKILEDAVRLCEVNSTPPQPQPMVRPILVIDRNYQLTDLDTIFDFDFKGSSGIKKSRRYSDMVLFKHSKSKKFPLKIVDGVLYFQGQDIGKPFGEPIDANKNLYDAYENKDIKIHLFIDYDYSGEYCFYKKPYHDDKGKWIFPLARP
ncbi:MAG: phospholipase D family protein [Methyloglobulus sp.]